SILLLKTPLFHTTAPTASAPARATAVVVKAGACALSQVGFTSNVVSADASWTFATWPFAITAYVPMALVVGTWYTELNIPPPMEVLVRVTLDPSGLIRVSCNRKIVELRGVPLRVASV